MKVFFVLILYRILRRFATPFAKPSQTTESDNVSVMESQMKGNTYFNKIVRTHRWALLTRKKLNVNQLTFKSVNGGDI
jgi:hypothetical protein